jgi:large subunit ribosomal protein L37e|eukprot:TRINITY_DN2698_c0_g1_i1.p1 TRINITY_DN2698_c0_g1~~TRINITY_DN2698_c0_g1_i1.p1  ORF type:complete len:168 (-),score=30.66 TRINITY_DN2698_c0_g1_i1:135-638(-)
MQLFAVTPNGETLALTVDGAATVGSLRASLAGVVGIPSDELLVAYAGQTLVAEQALSDTGIQDESTICVLARLRGGGDGTEAFGKMHKKTHGLCPRCGKRSYHKQNKRCAACGYPAAKKRSYEWSKKSKRRTAPGTGRCKYTKHIARRAKNGFRSGTVAPARRKNQK